MEIRQEVPPQMRKALGLAIDEVMENYALEPSSTGTLIMAFSIAHAINDGELNTERLVEIAVEAFDKTSIH